VLNARLCCDISHIYTGITNKVNLGLFSC